jgi:hypothetical protein
MSTAYKFKFAYTKSGVATAPTTAPTCTVVDTSDDILVNAGAMSSSLTNLIGVYLYTYNGSDNLDLVGRAHTVDTTVDQQDLYSYTNDFLRAAVDANNRVDLGKWIGTVPAAVTTNGYQQAVIMRLLTDDAGGTPVALSSGLFNANASSGVPTSAANAGAVWGSAARSLTDKALFTLTTDYDPAKTSAPTSSANAAAVNTVLSAAHGAGLWGGAAGAGSITWIHYVDDGTNPLDGVLVEVSTDSAKANVVASGYTDAFGNVTFQLDAGTYYFWKQRTNYNFTNPETVTVV